MLAGSCGLLESIVTSLVEERLERAMDEHINVRRCTFFSGILLLSSITVFQHALSGGINIE
jgi:hypothetical protein